MSEYIFIQYMQYKKRGGERKKYEGRNSHKLFEAAKLTAALRITRIYIVAISVLRGIQTFTVDKAAIISSNQLLLLLHINPSLPLYNFLPFFYFTHRYKTTHRIYFFQIFYGLS